MSILDTEAAAIRSALAESKPTLSDAMNALEAFIAGRQDAAIAGIARDIATIRAAITPTPNWLLLRDRAKALLESVDYDNNGRLVGMQPMGGNGGLISLDTTRAADQLRLALGAIDG